MKRELRAGLRTERDRAGLLNRTVSLNCGGINMKARKLDEGLEPGYSLT